MTVAQLVKTLLTADIWDTVLRRRCHPEEVKLHTARHLFLKHHAPLRDSLNSPRQLLDLRRTCEHDIGEQRQLSGGDDEYRIDEVLAEWVTRAFQVAPPAAERRALADELREVEIAQELFVSYPDDRIQAALNTHGDADLVLISDFYIGAEGLRRILQQVSPALATARLYVSSDLGLNKRSGRLFQEIYRAMDASPAAHVHVGDSPYADVAVPRRLGASAILYRNPPQDRRRAQLEARFSRRHENIAPYLAELYAQFGSGGGVGDTLAARELFCAGRRYALLFCGFVLMAVEESARRGADRIYYFTREGLFFRRIHEALRPRSPLGFEIVPSEILEVSRLSTFLPSLREFTPAEFMRLWNLYSTQSIRGWCASLGIDPQNLQPTFQRHGLSLDEPINYPWQDPRMMALLSDPEALAALTALRAERRDLFLRYLAARGIDSSSRRLMLVDIGWRGTIQDNIAYLLPNTHVHGAYFGCQRFLNDQPPNITKIVFGPNENCDGPLATMSLRFVAPIEMLTNAPGGSAAGYEDTPGGVQALCHGEEAEDRVFEQYTRHFQDGVLSAADVISDWIRTYAFTAAELRPHCLHLLRGLVCEPPRPLADAFFSLHHNETFGVGGFVQKRRRLPYGLLLRAAVSRRQRAEFLRFLDSTTWPQGFLRHSGLGCLCRRYNRALEKQLGCAAG